MDIQNGRQLLDDNDDSQTEGETAQNRFGDEIGDVAHAGKRGNDENQAGHGDKARGKHQPVTGVVTPQRQGRCGQNDGGR